MQQLIQQLINGVALGGLYALTAIGYSLVYGVMELVNFSHGSVYMLGAYVFYILMELAGLPLWLSLPGALAAKLVSPDRRVLVVTGDGGFLMNSQELKTAVREQLPFVVLVFVDNGYGLIKWKGMDRFGETHCCDFTNPDFVRYAEAMHCRGYRITSANELLPTLEEAFAQDVPAIVECPVDYSENTKLTEHLRDVYEHLSL